MTVPAPVSGIDWGTHEYKAAASKFATGVTVTTALRPDGAPIGLTVTSFTPLSFDPPLVMVSIQRSSRLLADLRSAGFFGVSVLAGSQRHISNRFASKTEDRFGSVEWFHGLTGVPLLEDVLAHFECALESTVIAGDHELLIGRVIHVASADGYPLLRYNGVYCEAALKSAGW